MKMYLAGCSWEHLWDDKKFYDFYRLESFFYISKKEIPMIGKYKSFLLDSGAFTFMNNVKKNQVLNWDEYLERYAAFINEYDIKLFFELDIDSIVGLKEVERLRAKLEKLTNKKCIPVWHKSRGIKDWIKTCKEYNYVAIGGIITKEIKPSERDIFIPLLKIANSHNCRVHGLGFTNIEGMKKYPFYSVDSTTWIAGNRFGKVYKFTGSTILTFDKPTGFKVKTEITAQNNFDEWVKFQKYVDLNL